MPQLIDLVGKMSINNVPSKNIGKSIKALRDRLPKEELTLENKLRTTFQVNSGKAFKTESSGLYAGWRDELNRVTSFDSFQRQPLNKVKTTDEEKEVKLLKKALKHQEWLKAVDERMAQMGFNTKKA